jgi:hypothetical protein
VGRTRRLPDLGAPTDPSRSERTPDRFDAVPAGLPFVEGRACLAAHAHAPDFTWQENFQVRGDLVQLAKGDWALVPRKLVGGFELPKGIARYRDIIKNHRRFYRTAKKRING